MMIIARRNLKLFFRDRNAVFMSFLSVLIILGLYVLFLGDMLRSGLPDAPRISFLMDSWIMAGILGVTTVTSTLGALGVMVDDRARKLLKDITAAPIKRRDIAGGYMLSAFAIGVILSAATLLLGQVYIVMKGGDWLQPAAMLKVVGLILISVLTSSSMLFCMTSLLRSQNAFSTTSTIIGTLIGFLMGIYIPIGSLPEPVQWVIKLFPVSHAGSLIRSVILERPIEQTFAGAPAEAARQFKLDMGVLYEFGGATMTAAGSVTLLLGTTIFFFALSTVLMRIKK